MGRTPTLDELERFFSDPVWHMVVEELENWLEDVRDLLEDPSKLGSSESLNDQALTAGLRGNAKALRNVLQIRNYLTIQAEQEQREDEENGPE